MKILFLIDYSSKSGYGHVNRSLSLISELIKLGVSIQYLLSEQPIPIKALGKGLSSQYSEDFFLQQQSHGGHCLNVNLLNTIISRWGPDAIVMDSYSINTFEARDLCKSIKTVVFERKDLDGYCDFLIDFMPFTSEENLNSNGKTCHLKGPQYFAARKPREVVGSRNGAILHTGGSYRYNQKPIFFKACAEEFRSRHIPITWLISNKNDEDKLIQSQLALIGDNFRYFDAQNSSLWREFEYTVGPPSGSLFESLIQGSVAITACTSESQNDNSDTWSKIGHLLHINSNNCSDPEKIKDVCSIAQECRLKLLDFSKKVQNRPSADGAVLIAHTIVKSIFSAYHSNGKNQSKNDLNIISREKRIELCVPEDIAHFRNARNLEKNRTVSTSSQPISWTEHVRWWLLGDVYRYKLVKNNKIIAFIWFRERKISNLNYLYGGWFPADGSAELNDAFEIVRWQVEEISPKYPDHKWIATFAKTNNVIPIINKRLGFVNASNSSLESAKILFPGTQQDQLVMEYPG